MVIRDDQAADPAFAAILIPTAVILGALTWRLWQPHHDDMEDRVEHDHPSQEQSRKQQMVPTTR
jgi:hypothetical protein